MSKSIVAATFLLALTAASASDSAFAQVTNNYGYGIFEQCQGCAIAAENDTAWQMITTGIANYNVKVSEGVVRPIAVGDVIQLESSFYRPNGWNILDHFWRVTSVPVTSWNNLTDLGKQRDSDSYGYVPAPSGDALSWVASYSLGGGTVNAYYGDLPWSP